MVVHIYLKKHYALKISIPEILESYYRYLRIHPMIMILFWSCSNDSLRLLFQMLFFFWWSVNLILFPSISHTYFAKLWHKVFRILKFFFYLLQSLTSKFLTAEITDEFDKK